MRRRTRRGATLIELLTVLAVVAVLAALALPGLRSARAAARQAGCVNNLKQIALALHNYHAANDSLPMSVVLGPGRGNGHTGFTQVLPYMEQLAVYNAYNFWLENWDESNATAVKARVEAFVCPDNDNRDNVRAADVRYAKSRSSFAMSHYGMNWGGGRGPWGEDFVKTRRTFRGVLIPVASPDAPEKLANIRFAQITDGTSFTLAVVEKRDSFGWAVGGWGGSEFDVFTSPAYAGDDPVARKVYTGSTHPEGPYAAYCDGSVRRLRPQTDPAVWYALVTRDGGEVIKPGDR